MSIAGSHFRGPRPRWSRQAVTCRRRRIAMNYSGCAARIGGAARRLWREVLAELLRLNRTGLATDTLLEGSRRDRGRIVATALSRRHENINRCC